MSGMTLSFLCIFAFSLAGFGEAIRCYHCYDSFNETLSLRSHEVGETFGEKFVRCDKNQNNWNTFNCPVYFPICVIVSGKVRNHYETIRTCAESDFCSKYQPPSGITLQYCKECKTDLCNDYYSEPPLGPGASPLFTFNININLNLKKNPLVSDQSKK